MSINKLLICAEIPHGDHFLKECHFFISPSGASASLYDEKIYLIAFRVVFYFITHIQTFMEFCPIIVINLRFDRAQYKVFAKPFSKGLRFPKAEVSAAASVGASAAQRSPPETRTPHTLGSFFEKKLHKKLLINSFLTHSKAVENSKPPTLHFFTFMVK